MEPKPKSEVVKDVEKYLGGLSEASTQARKAAENAGGDENFADQCVAKITEAYVNQCDENRVIESRDDAS